MLRLLAGVYCRLNGLGSPFGIETRDITTVALVGAEEEVSPPASPKKTEATRGELAEPEPPAPTRRWSARGWEPAAACSCGCGSADAPARRLWGRATHDEPSGGHPFRQSETRTAWPAR